MANDKVKIREIAIDFLNKNLTQRMVEEKFIIEDKNICNMSGDASSRLYFRFYNQDNDRSYVLCYDDQLNDVNTHPFVTKTNYFKKNGILCPQIILIDQKMKFLLLEDLGDQLLCMELYGISDKRKEKELFLKVIDLSIKLHSIRPSKKDIELFPVHFDQKKLDYETEFTCEHFLRSRLGKTTDLQERIDGIQFYFSQIINRRIASFQRVLCHRDFHSKNLIIKNNNLYMIDYQDACWGIPQYDLVSLLEDCYYGVSSLNKEDLKLYYWESILHRDPFFDQKDWCVFDHNYRLMTLQRVFKAIGSFCFLSSVKKKNQYLKYIHFGMEKIRENLDYCGGDLKDLKKDLFYLYEKLSF